MSEQYEDGPEFVDGEVLEDLTGQDSEYGAEPDGDEDDEDMNETPPEDDSIHCFEGHEDAVVSVAWANNELVASGGCDNNAYIWRVGQDAYEATSGSMGTFELKGHTDTVVSLAFNFNGNLLATGGMDGLCKIWDATNGKLLQTLEGSGGAIEWVTWHPKGNVVLAGTEDMLSYMWMAATGQEMQIFSGHSGVVSAGTFTPDGKTVVTVGGEDDCSLRAWNPKTGVCTTHIKGNNFHREAITCVAISKDSEAAITGGVDGGVCISNVSTGRILGQLSGHENSVESVGFCADLPLAASADVDGKLLVWDCGSLQLRGTCEHPTSITRMVLHPKQPLAFTACLDGVLRIWDLRTAKCLKEMTGHVDAIQDLALSPDGQFVLTGGDDNACRVFSVNSSKSD